MPTRQVLQRTMLDLLEKATSDLKITSKAKHQTEAGGANSTNSDSPLQRPLRKAHSLRRLTFLMHSITVPFAALQLFGRLLPGGSRRHRFGRPLWCGGRQCDDGAAQLHAAPQRRPADRQPDPSAPGGLWRARVETF